MICALPCAAEPFSTLPSQDNIPWKFETKGRVVALSDTHGDLEAMLAVLLERRLIDETGKWIGGDSHLVVNGDLIAGGKYSRFLLDFLMALEPQAKAAGGNLHVTLGNMELLAMQKKKNPLSSDEIKQFKGAPTVKGHPRNALRHDSDYARWLREKSLIIQINDRFYVHGGWHPEWFENNKVQDINFTARAWIRYFQGGPVEPPLETKWVVDEAADGPAWTRAFKPRRRYGRYVDERNDGAPKYRQVLEGLATFGAAQAVLGHLPSRWDTIITDHPYYGKSVALIDVGLRRSGKRPGSLEIVQGEAKPFYAAKDPRSWTLLSRLVDPSSVAPVEPAEPISPVSPVSPVIEIHEPVASSRSPTGWDFLGVCSKIAELCECAFGGLGGPGPGKP